MAICGSFGDGIGGRGMATSSITCGGQRRPWGRAERDLCDFRAVEMFDRSIETCVIGLKV